MVDIWSEGMAVLCVVSVKHNDVVAFMLQDGFSARPNPTVVSQ
jgi:hypothetical protein